VQRRRALISPLLIVVLLLPATVGAQREGKHAQSKSAAAQEKLSLVLRAMQDELDHSMGALKSQPVPAYFLSYEIIEHENVAITSSFGMLASSTEGTQRMLHIDLRVGDYKLDNTHTIRGGSPFAMFADRFSSIEVPLENDPAAIRSVIWYHTDRRYKSAVEQFTRVKANVQVKVEAEDKSADFSAEPPEQFSEPVVKTVLDRKKWEEKVRRYSAPFAKYGDIYGATATLSVVGETRWYVNSEGSVIQTSQPYYRLYINAFSKADDGMELPLYRSFFATSENGLPDDGEIAKAAEKMIADLHALRKAPVVDPYQGPAILSGRASGVFFHEIFGHRIEGHRQKQEQEAQTFKKMVNQKVLPEFVSVYFDPTSASAGGTELAGTYRFDDEGVKARRVAVVQDGVLKSFLMSRSPIEGFSQSNGHGRAQAGFSPVSRQSNLIVETKQKVTRAELKKMLIERIKKDDKPFGLLFDDIMGGFTFTGRTVPNAFNVIPEVVYRVYPDGREELVRGVDLIGTPLSVFARIVAVDDEVGVFNGICGAESGGVPVGAASPGILLSQIEVQKKEKSQERPPLLPPPFSTE
jgi:TldD protein